MCKSDRQKRLIKEKVKAKFVNSLPASPNWSENLVSVGKVCKQKEAREHWTLACSIISNQEPYTHTYTHSAMLSTAVIESERVQQQGEQVTKVQYKVVARRRQLRQQQKQVI